MANFLTPLHNMNIEHKLLNQKLDVYGSWHFSKQSVSRQKFTLKMFLSV